MRRALKFLPLLGRVTRNYSFSKFVEDFCWDKSEKKYRFYNDVVDSLLQPLLDECGEYTEERLIDIGKQLSEALVEAKESTDANIE